MKFATVAEAYAFYRNLNVETMESRSKAIQTEIASNADADIQALGIELEAIESAIGEKRGDERPKGYRTPEQGMQKPQHPGFTATERTEGAASSKLYRSAFYKHLLGNDLTADERTAFEAANAEKRADAFNNLSNAAAVVPTTTLDEVLVKARDAGGVMGVSRAFTMPSNVRIPIATPGEAASWHTEGAKVDSGKADPTYVQFNAFEVMKVLSMSVAAQTMSIDAFEAYLTEELSASVMAAIAKAMVDGTGEGEGTGILSGIEWDATNTVTIAEDAVLTFRDVLATIAKLHRGYANGARFVMNNATLYNDVYGISDDNNHPIYLADFVNGGAGRILGYEVVIDDYLDDGEILFGNFSYMGYNLPAGIMLDVSRESSFKSGLVDYRAMAVADCKPLVGEAFVRVTKDTE